MKRLNIIMLITFGVFILSTVIARSQVIELEYDSATVLKGLEKLEVAVDSYVRFDPSGFTLYSSDKIQTYLVTGSQFDPIPTIRFYNTGEVLPADSTEMADNTSTRVYGVVGYQYLQVIVMNLGDIARINKSLFILKKDSTGIILH